MDKGNADAAGAVVATPQLAAAALLSPAARLVVTNKIQLWLLCSVLQGASCGWHYKGKGLLSHCALKRPHSSQHRKAVVQCLSTAETLQ